MHYDPKFAKPDLTQNKVKVDARFFKMMTDPRFAIGNSLDKYGRKKANSKNQN